MRLDQYLVERGYYETREQAKRAILAGEVELKGRGRLLKPGERVGREEPEVHIRARPPFVSRSGNKLSGALEAWGLRVEACGPWTWARPPGLYRLPAAEGASEVIALDVGKGQLHWKLRNDERVHVMEGINARFLSPDDLPFRPDLAVIDVPFISLILVLGPLVAILSEGDPVVALVKPQFEAGRQQVGKGGVVRDAKVHRRCLKTIAASRGTGGFTLIGWRRLRPGDVTETGSSCCC